MPLTNPDPTKTTSYRLARAAVIILGALLALAFVLLVVGLVWRMTGHSPSRVAATGADQQLEMTFPAGTRILSTDTQQGRLIVRVRLPSGEEDIDIIDTETGRLVGQVKAPQAGAK